MKSIYPFIDKSGGKDFKCLALEAYNPESGLPCIYIAVVDEEKELGAVRICPSLILSSTRKWSQILKQAVSKFKSEHWLQKILAAPGKTYIDHLS